jgi:hypothetical protein
MTCQSCEERRKLIIAQVEAFNAAMQARSQAFMEAVKNRKPWREPQDERQS